jgi:hypothetical protein
VRHVPEHPVTTAGFVSGTRSDALRTPLSRLAAAASLMLALVQLVLLPVLLGMAGYVGVLALAFATAALAGGAALWWRATLVPRAVTGIAAACTLVAELLQTSVGFPGVRGVAPPVSASVAAVALAVAVLLLLLADTTQRRPQPSPDHPYAL